MTLTFDVRMNNALRAAMITWFQQLPAIVVTLLPRDPLSRFIHISGCHTRGALTTGVQHFLGGGVVASDAHVFRRCLQARTHLWSCGPLVSPLSQWVAAPIQSISAVRKPWPAGQIGPVAHFRVARMAVSTTQISTTFLDCQ